jgi:hypothetical protein
LRYGPHDLPRAASGVGIQSCMWTGSVIGRVVPGTINGTKSEPGWAELRRLVVADQAHASAVMKAVPAANPCVAREAAGCRPGTTTVAREASSGCGSRLSGYLNPQLAISLAQSYVYPNKVAWTADTRTVICEVHASSRGGQLTGSVRGASLPR